MNHLLECNHQSENLGQRDLPEDDNQNRSKRCCILIWASEQGSYVLSSVAADKNVG